MKYILISLIIVLLIGIYTYAHVNRYEMEGIQVLDTWTGKTYQRHIIGQQAYQETYIEVGKPGKEVIK